MLKVHVWPPSGNMVGHTSLTYGNNYVSFWPENDAGKKDLKIKTSHPGLFVSELKEDILAEGRRQPITIVINDNIDEEALENYILDLQRSTPKYQLARYNCSNVVIECLKVACGKEPSFYPTAQGYAGKLGRIF
ncbi:MAG: hypothetical protein AAGB12_07705, partial [Pseudomonadota bacterium]